MSQVTMGYTYANRLLGFQRLRCSPASCFVLFYFFRQEVVFQLFFLEPQGFSHAPVSGIVLLRDSDPPNGARSGEKPDWGFSHG